MTTLIRMRIREAGTLPVADLRGFAEFDPDLLAAAVEGAAGYPVLGRRLLHRHPALDRLQGRVQVILRNICQFLFYVWKQ